MFLFFDKSAFGEAFADEGFGVFDFKQQVGFVRFDADEVFIALIAGGEIYAKDGFDYNRRFSLEDKGFIERIFIGGVGAGKSIRGFFFTLLDGYFLFFLLLGSVGASLQ